MGRREDAFAASQESITLFKELASLDQHEPSQEHRGANVTPTQPTTNYLHVQSSLAPLKGAPSIDNEYGQIGIQDAPWWGAEHTNPSSQMPTETSLLRVQGTDVFSPTSVSLMSLISKALTSFAPSQGSTPHLEEEEQEEVLGFGNSSLKHIKEANNSVNEGTSSSLSTKEEPGKTESLKQSGTIADWVVVT
jgi:hypothetical protein